MGGRGGAGGGRGTGGNSNPDLDSKDSLDNTAEQTSNPNAAADALGLTGADKEHFVNGANAEGKRIPRIGRDESQVIKPADVSKLVAAHKAAVVAYERKHGRYAAHAYARGGYWSLLRVIRTAMAVGAIATQAPAAPALAAANTALMAAYWTHRAGR
ncbi:hypothetical protein J4U00_gp119 [Mycobacterium phage DyoEdafos]|uniref:Uncharacterized protein n=1 Tax=Mycobacterium phage DyoEdafos TaxID=2599860 RepID=A0A5J6THU7_9CAUD|nr:hypothetical protein J4U00_gp119 [Mycobacterium phage DyoEdafos]QFG10360.1 hypothetical protein SEA_DYOEDAFOS_150 [Mycobacterium phage DyoEdafos]